MGTKIETMNASKTRIELLPRGWEVGEDTITSPYAVALIGDIQVVIEGDSTWLKRMGEAFLAAATIAEMVELDDLLVTA